MNRCRLALVACLAFASLLGAGCGHSHESDTTTVVTVSSGTYEPFTLTVENDTTMTLLPGPIVADPYDPDIPTVALAPGESATYSIGFLPSSITVGATGVGAFSSYVYPTRTLDLGFDYSAYASGATFIYR
jgi:hypothetical protein